MAILPRPEIPPPQDVQPPLTRTTSLTRTVLPLPPPEDLLQPQRPTPTPPETLPGRAPETITVERFEVVGSTVFSPEQLAKVLAPSPKADLVCPTFQARSAVTKLYIDQGYITSGAYIPPQRPERRRQNPGGRRWLGRYPGDWDSATELKLCAHARHSHEATSRNRLLESCNCCNSIL